MPAAASASQPPEIAVVPESVLDARAAAGLPAAAAPAPWDVALEAVVWWHRATPAAAAMLPPALRGRRRVPLTIGALVRYLDTPVGPYDEVLASPLLLVDRGVPATHVAFIAVDSPASVAGGRANWALPKVPARFAWAGRRGALTGHRGPVVASAAGEAGGVPWAVAVRARPSGPRLPVAAPGRDLQVTAAGTVLDVPARLRGRARPALVTVRTTGPSLPGWLVAGRHLGAVVTGVRGVVGAPG